ncbi:hypothetical protein ABLQ75_20260, partial [Pseudomonas aeruginosa]|uniref:hypothetical protein n=1 Tax=Pseudomonas aeruginosa TaxID=287 RepID=UPI0032B4A484
SPPRNVVLVAKHPYQQLHHMPTDEMARQLENLARVTPYGALQVNPLPQTTRNPLEDQARKIANRSSLAYYYYTHSF